MSWEAFKAVCGLLHGGQPALAAGVAWEDLIAMAGDHMVTPALMAPVSASRAAPPEVQDYFSAFHALNGARNQGLLETLQSTLTRLQDAGFQSLILKGAASLVTQVYRDPSERLVGDIDLLLRPGDLRDAYACLVEAGYSTLTPETRRWIRPSVHHAPTLVAPGSGIGIELHQRLSRRAKDDLVSTGSIHARARAVAWGDRSVHVPSATDRVIHNIVHDQIHHRGFERGTTELRQLRELGLLSLCDKDEIDWPEVRRRFADAGWLKVLHKQVALSRALLGIDIPIAVSDPNRFVDDLARALSDERRASFGLKAAWRTYASAFAEDPLLALNVLDPRSWPGRVRSIRALLAGSTDKSA